MRRRTRSAVALFPLCGAAALSFAACGDRDDGEFFSSSAADGGHANEMEPSVEGGAPLASGGSQGRAGAPNDAAGAGGTQMSAAEPRSTVAGGSAERAGGAAQTPVELGGAGGATAGAAFTGDDATLQGGVSGGAGGAAAGADNRDPTVAGAAGSGGDGALSACEQLGSRCHSFDLGIGAPHDCYELSRARDEVQCAARREDCEAACADAAVLPFLVQFAARVGDRAYDCAATYAGVGADGATIHPVDFRFYVHGVELIDDAGEAVPAVLDQDGVWQSADVALLDFATAAGRCAGGTAATNTRIVGTVPRRVYRGLAFKLGVPFELNHTDLSAAPAPLAEPTLFLSRNAGRQFLSLVNAAEVSPLIATFESLLQVHSTGCSEDVAGVSACSKPNRPEYRFEQFWHPSSHVVADVKEVLAMSQVRVDRCQSVEAAACAWPFEILGLHWQTGAPDAAFQRFLRAEEP